jgi:hypothetical protein
LGREIAPNHQEILATPPSKKKKKKKKKKATLALPLFYEATHSYVSPKYKSKNISTNVSSTKLPGRELIDRSAWNVYPDPWNEERLALVKDAASHNVWYNFFYNVFLDGGKSRWGGGG